MNAEPALSRFAQIDSAWAAAAERVASYLRAHRLTNHAQLSRLTSDIIGIARARQQPGEDPLVVAMATVEAGMASWFALLMSDAGATDAQRLNRGRLALAMGEVPSRWPEHFLREGAVPAELLQVMGEADLGRSPEIKFSNMAPRRSFAPGSADVTARPKWQVSISYRWPFVRVVMSLALVLTLAGATLAAGR
ncbi:MAG: hypothetical protein ABI222_07810 [Opitutaceae bacterium]